MSDETTTLDLDAIAERFLTAEFPNASFFESQRDVPALVAEVRRLRTNNVNATRGALDDLAKVRAELDIAHIHAEHDANAAAENAAMVATLARKLTDARAALRQYAPRCECGALATRLHAATASFCCDAHAVGEGWSDTTHAAAVRAAMEGGR